MDEQAKQILHLKDSILLAVFKEGGVVFDLESRVCHELNHAGTQILNLLDGRKNINDIADTLAGRSAQSTEVLRGDIHKFLKDLIERGWVYVS